MVNCYDGTNVINERHTVAGDLTTDRNTYLASGAQDDIGNYSLKLISSSRSDFAAMPLDCFAFDIENTVTGVSKTATVEIVSSGVLNNNDIRLLLEYMGGVTIYSTWNPADKSAGITLSNNNLTAAQSSGSNGVRGATALAGKVYFEITPATMGGGTNEYGIASASAGLTSATTAQYAVVSNAGGNINTNGTSFGTITGTITTGAVIGIAVDVSNKLVWFRVGSGVWNSGGTANPATGIGGASFSSLIGPPYPFYAAGFGSDSVTVNFGATAFANSVPSGFTGVDTLDTTNPIASFADSLPSVLTPASALPSSSNTWTIAATAMTTSWNPADLANITLSNSNLTATGVANGGARAVASASSGKYYWENTYATLNTNNLTCGIALASGSLASPGAGVGLVARASGNITINGSTSGSSIGAVAASSVVGIAVDFTAQLIWFRIAPSGNWNGSSTANPATGTGGVSISTMSGTLYPYVGVGGGDVMTTNFGASAFTGAVPAGFTAGFTATPVKQLLQVTFTPQRAGRVRGLVRLGKVSTTCWVNPQIAIT